MRIQNIQKIQTAIKLLTILTVLTGVVYPLIVTIFAQTLFFHSANGSLIKRNDTVIGSDLIGQEFSSAKYFWSRPSLVSNLAQTNPKLIQIIQARIDNLHKADPNNKLPIPIGLLAGSASGLDPHISLLDAFYQVSRIAKVRDINERKIKSLILQLSENDLWGMMNNNYVNVLRLNLALDSLKVDKEKI